MRLVLLFAALVSVEFCATVKAQSSWVETPSLLTASYTASAPYKAFYVNPIAIRSGQQALYFSTAGTAFIRMDVCIITQTEVCEPDGTGPGWIQIYQGPSTYSAKRWYSVPQTPGEYTVRLRYYKVNGNGSQSDFRLGVVPDAYRAFSDGQSNTMMMWQGTTTALNSPFLVVEGLDAENINSANSYYGIGSTLFGLGRARGADVIILNFADGGADMRLNAEVVEDAISYVNQIKTGSRKPDVAGVSMGGVVARYALAEMEDDGLVHNVGRFVSIDAPQQGAVIDEELLVWLHDPPSWAEGNFDAPLAITSIAGKQLLQSNPFDTASPSQHDQFFDELNALNGDGYPHQTTENVGVSFGISSQNPQPGFEWLEIEADAVDNAHFYIESGTPEAGAGSLLPRDITDIGGVVLYHVPYIGIHVTVEAGYNLDRKAHPTFIPYDSALDRLNGTSRFDGALIDAEISPKFHDRVPSEIVEPLLTRLGYPPPPYSVSISGPTSLPEWDTGTWHATIPGDACTGTATCRWERRTNYPGRPGDPGDPTRGLPCGSGATWLYSGTGGSIQRQMPVGALSLELRVEATRGTEHVWDYHTVVSTSARQGAELQAGVPVASASAEVGLPLAFALGGAHPNPFNPQTVLRFAVPEASVVRLSVFDALGREVTRLVDGRVEAGHHEARFDGSPLPSGVYLVRLSAGAAVATMRLTLLK